MKLRAKKYSLKHFTPAFISILIICFTFTNVQAFACTSVLAGKNATADGSVMIARNEDVSYAWAKHFVVKERTSYKPGDMFKATDNNFEYPQPEISYKYTATPNWDQSEGYFEEAGINEFQVAVSATESATNNEKANAADPLVEDGLTEASIPSIVLPRVKTAKEGVAFVGKVVEEKGSAEVFGMAIADPNEAWYLEAGSGHHWVAVRVPDDSYMIAANQLRIGNVDLMDTQNYMGSSDIVSFAAKNGLYSHSKDGKFNFAKAFGTDGANDYIYNYPRVWWGEKMLTPSLDLKQGLNNYPLFAKPDKKLSPQDIMAVLRSHYDGTEFDVSPESPKYLRPISINTTMESHVLQLRSWLPNPIGGIHWLALGVPETSVYVPFYSGISDTPKAYKTGTDTYDTQSAYWAFRSVNVLTNSNYTEYSKIVTDMWKGLEAQYSDEITSIDSTASSLYEQDPKKCEKFLTMYSNYSAQNAVEQARELEQQLITKSTKLYKQN